MPLASPFADTEETAVLAPEAPRRRLVSPFAEVEPAAEIEPAFEPAFTAGPSEELPEELTGRPRLPKPTLKPPLKDIRSATLGLRRRFRMPEGAIVELPRALYRRAATPNAPMEIVEARISELQGKNINPPPVEKLTEEELKEIASTHKPRGFWGTLKREFVVEDRLINKIPMGVGAAAKATENILLKDRIVRLAMPDTFYLGTDDPQLIEDQREFTKWYNTEAVEEARRSGEGKLETAAVIVANLPTLYADMAITTPAFRWGLGLVTTPAKSMLGKAGLKAMGGLVGAAAQSSLMGMRAIENATERQIPEFVFNSKDAANVSLEITRMGESDLVALWHGWLKNYNEVLFEHAGEAFSAGGQAILRRVAPKIPGPIIQKLAQIRTKYPGTVRALKKLSEIGVQDPASEWTEERLTAVANVLAGIDEDARSGKPVLTRLAEAALPSTEQTMAELIAFTVFPAGTVVAGTAIDATRKRSAQTRLRRLFEEDGLNDDQIKEIMEKETAKDRYYAWSSAVRFNRRLNARLLEQMQQADIGGPIPSPISRTPEEVLTIAGEAGERRGAREIVSPDAEASIAKTIDRVATEGTGQAVRERLGRRAKRPVVGKSLEVAEVELLAQSAVGSDDIPDFLSQTENSEVVRSIATQVVSGDVTEGEAVGAINQLWEEYNATQERVEPERGIRERAEAEARGIPAEAGRRDLLGEGRAVAEAEAAEVEPEAIPLTEPESVTDETFDKLLELSDFEIEGVLEETGAEALDQLSEAQAAIALQNRGLEYTGPATQEVQDEQRRKQAEAERVGVLPGRPERVEERGAGAIPGMAEGEVARRAEGVEEYEGVEVPVLIERLGDLANYVNLGLPEDAERAYVDPSAGVVRAEKITYKLHGRITIAEKDQAHFRESVRAKVGSDMFDALSQAEQDEVVSQHQALGAYDGNPDTLGITISQRAVDDYDIDVAQEELIHLAQARLSAEEKEVMGDVEQAATDVLDRKFDETTPRGRVLGKLSRLLRAPPAKKVARPTPTAPVPEAAPVIEAKPPEQMTPEERVPAPDVDADIRTATESNESIAARTPAGLGGPRDAAMTARRQAAERVAATLRPGDRIQIASEAWEIVDQNLGNGRVQTARNPSLDAAAEIQAGSNIERGTSKRTIHQQAAETVHRKEIRQAIREKKPVSAAAVDAYDIKLPEGWVREGDRYVFRAEAKPAEAAKPPEARPRLPAGRPTPAEAAPEDEAAVRSRAAQDEARALEAMAKEADAKAAQTKAKAARAEGNETLAAEAETSEAAAEEAWAKAARASRAARAARTDAEVEADKKAERALREEGELEEALEVSAQAEAPPRRFAVAGRRALTANIGMADRAEQMERELLDGRRAEIARKHNIPIASVELSPVLKEAVWKRIADETGWHRVVEGEKWMFEIDDSKMRFDMRGKPDQVALADVVSHPDLFENYPQLQNTQVVFKHDSSVGRGTLHHERGYFWIEVDAKNGEHKRQVLTHEIQHAIQEIEGFRRGTSIVGVERMRPRFSEQVAKLKETDPAVRAWIEEQDALFADKLDPAFADKLVEHDRNAPEAIKRIWRENALWNDDAQRLYMRHTGEALARVASRRLDMTPDQRKAETPRETLKKMLREEGLLKADLQPEDVLISREEGRRFAARPTPAEADALRGDTGNDPLTRETNQDEWAQRNPKSAAVLRKAVDEAGIGEGTRRLSHGTRSKRLRYEFPLFSHFGTRKAAERRMTEAHGIGTPRVLDMFVTIRNPLRVEDLGLFSPFDIVAAVSGRDAVRRLAEVAVPVLSEAERTAAVKQAGFIDDQATDAELVDAAMDAFNLNQRGSDVYELLYGQARDARSGGNEPQSVREEAARIADESPYDGLVYRNEVEDPGKDSYVAFRPNQAKSADLATFRDDGTVIPIAERFQPELPDIRFAARRHLPARAARAPEEKPAAFRRVSEEAIRSYIQSKNIPKVREEAVQMELSAMVNTIAESSPEPYLVLPPEYRAPPERRLPPPGRKEPRNIMLRKLKTEGIRSRAEILAMIPTPEEFKEAFLVGDVVSSLIPDMLSEEIPGFQIHGQIIKNPQDAAALVMALRSPAFESMKAVYLDSEYKALAAKVVTKGILDASIIHPREFFRNMPKGTRHLILSHNHPSGDPKPSDADMKANRSLTEAAEAAGLKVLDHIITDDTTFYSFAEGTFKDFTPAGIAEWEAVARYRLRKIIRPVEIAGIIRNMRQGDPGVAHIIYLTASGTLTAIERFPIDISLKILDRRLALGIGREAASAVIIDWPKNVDEIWDIVGHIQNIADVLDIWLLDVAALDHLSVREGTGRLKPLPTSSQRRFAARRVIDPRIEVFLGDWPIVRRPKRNDPLWTEIAHPETGAIPPKRLREGNRYPTWDAVLEAAKREGLAPPDATSPEALRPIYRAGRLKTMAALEREAEATIPTPEAMAEMEREEAEKKKRAIMIPEDALGEGDFVYMEGKWFRASKQADGTTLRNGKSIKLAKGESIPIGTHVPTDAWFYSGVVTEFNAQEGVTPARRRLPVRKLKEVRLVKAQRLRLVRRAERKGKRLLGEERARRALQVKQERKKAEEAATEIKEKTTRQIERMKARAAKQQERAKERREAHLAMILTLQSRIADVRTKQSAIIKFANTNLSAEQRGRVIAKGKSLLQMANEASRQEHFDEVLKFAEELRQEGIKRVEVGKLRRAAKKLKRLGIRELGPGRKEAAQSIFDAYQIDMPRRAEREAERLARQIETGKLVIEMESDKDDLTPDFIVESLRSSNRKRPEELTTDEVRYLTFTLEKILEEQKAENRERKERFNKQTRKDVQDFAVATSEYQPTDIENGDALGEIFTFRGAGGKIRRFNNSWRLPTRTIAWDIDGGKEGSVTHAVIDPLSEGVSEKISTRKETGEAIQAIVKKVGLEKLETMSRAFHTPIMKAFRKALKLKAFASIELKSYQVGGKTIKLTTGERMAIYLHTRNEDNLRHLLGGGFALRTNIDTNLVPTADEVVAIIDSLSEKEKHFAEEVQKIIFDGIFKGKLNERSLDLNGFLIAEVLNYFPIITKETSRFYDPYSKEATLTDLKAFSKFFVEAYGMLLQRQAGAKNTIVLYDIFESVQRSSELVGMYHAYAGALRRAKAFIRGKILNEEGKVIDTVQDLMIRTYGKPYFDAIRSLIYDVEGSGANADPAESLYRNELALIVRGTLGYNIPVVALQYLSYLTSFSQTKAALNGVNFSDFLYGLFSRAASYELMGKYSSKLWEREKGVISVAMGELVDQSRTRDMFLPNDAVINDASMKPLSYGDRQSTGRIWQMLHHFVQRTKKHLKPGTDEFYEEVARITDKFMSESQSTYSIVDRSRAQRSKAAWLRTLTLFSSQVTKIASLKFKNFRTLEFKLQDIGKRMKLKTFLDAWPVIRRPKQVPKPTEQVDPLIAHPERGVIIPPNRLKEGEQYPDWETVLKAAQKAGLAPRNATTPEALRSIYQRGPGLGRRDAIREAAAAAREYIGVDLLLWLGTLLVALVRIGREKFLPYRKDPKQDDEWWQNFLVRLVKETAIARLSETPVVISTLANSLIEGFDVAEPVLKQFNNVLEGAKKSGLGVMQIVMREEYSPTGPKKGQLKGWITFKRGLDKMATGLAKVLGRPEFNIYRDASRLVNALSSDEAEEDKKKLKLEIP